ncbi:hypothetical protein [Puniceicoccus vermicola]|uniref:Uncharacterized protein n=1 Tax=Puniceicoccus vermicola TaxID=388746 RepID=A0A7X1E7I3_9BACT|nr:hypothetical protein [Puniceicoccus vermicola]MBC2603772.1 hypothetical protein [Puniceicoccus vermicola]
MTAFCSGKELKISGIVGIDLPLPRKANITEWNRSIGPYEVIDPGEGRDGSIGK